MNEQIAGYLSIYARMIDYSDDTQKQNYKWVSMYVQKFHKKIPVDEMIRFLLDAIHIQHRYIARGFWLKLIK